MALGDILWRRVSRLTQEAASCRPQVLLTCRLALVLRGFDVVDQVHERVHRLVAQVVRAFLDGLHARLEFLLRPLVAGLACVVDIEQRAAHLVIADLVRAHAFVRHVAIGARHAGSRVDALLPQLKLRVLRF
jgi:hypothetical protein